jgi:hypothetical protein
MTKDARKHIFRRPRGTEKLNTADRAKRRALHIEMQLLAAVPVDFRDELRRFLRGGTLGAHSHALFQSMRRGKPDIGALFRYGMEHLPSDESRPDDTLTAFFVVLSELHPCSLELRIFATKCMEYCESDALDGWSESLPTLQQCYEVLASHMKRTSQP